MNEVILAYERINKETMEGWNYNGRIEPSALPLNTYTLDTLISNQFLLDWYNALVITSPNIVPTCRCVFAHKPPNAVGPTIKLISELTTEKYAYIIEIQNSWLLRHISHYAISEKVLNDVRSGQAHIVILYPNEGDIGTHPYLLRQLVADLNVPKEQVFLLHGDYNTDAYKDEPYTYVPINWVAYWLESFKRDHLIEYTPSKLYTCYNRQTRNHRVIMMSLLYQNNLIEAGLTSFGPGLLETKQPLKRTLTGILNRPVDDDEIEFFNTISNSSPDDLNLGIDNPATNIVEEHYRNSFVSVINETLTNSIFFTEKIYKPILIGHPFLLMGAPNQLAKLREHFGFKTFGQWWDESYDQIDDMHLRAKSIVDILVSLNSKSEQELIEIREEMKPVLKHNQNLYNSIVSKKDYGNDQLIWNFLHKLFNP
jgi:hypothetical protein